ncbi:hypothetical protein WJX74_009095 [Apatococcus lobatus]|uniref:Membrane insertase YidC/Oxa/ALB C-terminal domain-containing protein n=1 Tax=Apatococcus lobatus TaxID=904363 RepID=A0AAW1R334_9CHLO
MQSSLQVGGPATLGHTCSHLLGRPQLSGSQRHQRRQRRSSCQIQALLAEPGWTASTGAAANLVASSQQSLEHAARRLATLADAAASVQATAEQATQAAQQTAASGNSGGFFGPIAKAFEVSLAFLDTGIEKIGVPYSYGFAIILLTLLVKAATYPLSRKQVESTLAIQQIQPRVKEIQDRYKDGDQQEMQVEVARLYQQANVNPLAGCLPTLVTIPVWIGLYRALSNVADRGLLTEGFFWIPSLAGPTTLAARTTGGGFSWLFPFKDGAPPIGWGEASAYLVLPVLLVVSQYVSQAIISPTSGQDQSQQSSQAFLKFLPLILGYFSLNVPSGLTLYWFTNNLLSTAQQVYLKSSIKTPAVPGLAQAGQTPKAGASMKPSAPSSSSASEFPAFDSDYSKKPSGKEMGSRKKKGDKFAQLKASEQAKRAAKVGGQAVATALGNEPASAGRGAEAAVESAGASDDSPVKQQVKQGIQDGNGKH